VLKTKVTQEGSDCDDLAANAQPPERFAARNVVNKKSEVLSVKSGHEGERQEDGCDDRQLLGDFVLPVRR
jgi:hypothetical protein